jgi:hypothetical protein
MMVSPGVGRARSVTTMVFGPPTEREFAINHWDAHVEPGSDQWFILILRSPGALRRMCTPPSELAFAEGSKHQPWMAWA